MELSVYRTEMLRHFALLHWYAGEYAWFLRQTREELAFTQGALRGEKKKKGKKKKGIIPRSYEAWETDKYLVSNLLLGLRVSPSYCTTRALITVPIAN